MGPHGRVADTAGHAAGLVERLGVAPESGSPCGT